MAEPEEPEHDSFQQRNREFAERQDALRKISDQIRRLQTELNELNERRWRRGVR